METVEKYIDCIDKVLSEISFSHENNKVPVLSDLLLLWLAGRAEIWCP
jgi:hypothetical protein